MNLLDKYLHWYEGAQIITNQAPTSEGKSPYRSRRARVRVRARLRARVQVLVDSHLAARASRAGDSRAYLLVYRQGRGFSARTPG